MKWVRVVIRKFWRDRGSSKISENSVFCTFKLGYLGTLTCWGNSEARFGVQHRKRRRKWLVFVSWPSLVCVSSSNTSRRICINIKLESRFIFIKRKSTSDLLRNPPSCEKGRRRKRDSCGSSRVNRITGRTTGKEVWQENGGNVR